jgi:hypothetical protein
MRAPQTKTLFFLAVGLFILTTISIAPNYPAPFPVLGLDGKPLLGPDGRPLVHRDMASYYRDLIPALIFLAGSLCFLGWWLVRILRLIYGRIAAGKS